MTTAKILIPLSAGLLCFIGASDASAQNTVATPFGKDVRVVLKTGAQVTGKLVDLTPTEVVVREERSTGVTHRALADVKLVETRTHVSKALAIVGAGAGVVVALASDLCGTGEPYAAGGQEPACITAKPLLYTGAGAAIGAVIGGLIDQSRKRFLYVAPPGSVRMLPVVAPDRIGGRVVIRW